MAFGQKSAPVDVFIVDADPSQRRALAGLIAERTLGRFQALPYASHGEALAAPGQHTGAIMIADIETIGGTERLAELAGSTGPLIATSATSSLQAAVAAVRAGAVDFLPKPIGAKALIERLEAAVASFARKAPPPAPLDPSSNAPQDFAGFIGRSPAMRELYEQIRRVASSSAPVFITGESGTGKEICAEAVHTAAGAAGRPFVAINCSAIPKDLMESEIFGHVRGAFTGASADRAGAAELADGGTLFLDEIAEMDLGLQAKLLRFIQTQSFRRVGGSEVKHVNLRFICATNRDPFAEVEAGRFRGDLFYRLHVLPLHLSPLRERGDDILVLAERFLRRFADEEGRAFRGFDREAAEHIRSYPWPGNVRQLENAIRRIVVLHDGKAVTADMLPATLVAGHEASPDARTSGTASTATASDTAIAPFWQQEQQIIEGAVAAFSGNIARAAAALEISPSTIYRKRQAWVERLRAS